VCWPKFARYFDVELRQIPCEGNRLIMSPEEVIKRCGENTIGVVPALGVTYTLQYEPVQAVAEALDDLEEETGLDIRGNSWAFRASERHVSAETYCRQSDPRGVELAEQRRRPKRVRRSGNL
jgi:hypothetical protein